jgi:hypothetical protein
VITASAVVTTACRAKNGADPQTHRPTSCSAPPIVRGRRGAVSLEAMTSVVRYRRATRPFGHLTPCLHMHARYGTPVRLPRSPHCGLPLLTPDADDQAFLSALDSLAGYPVGTEAVEISVPWGLVCIAFQQTPARLKQWPRMISFGPAPRDISVLFARERSCQRVWLALRGKEGRRVELTVQTPS